MKGSGDDSSSIGDEDPLFPSDHTVTFVGRSTGFVQFHETTISLNFDAAPMSSLKDIAISVNGVAQSTLTPEALGPVNLDLSTYHGTVDIDALASFTDGKFARNRVTLEINLAGDVSTIDSNCMTNSTFDACIFYKSPVAQKGAPFVPAIQSTTDLSAYQIFGVKITNQSLSTLLQNPNIRVFVSNGTQANPTASGNWKKAYNQETGHYTAQVMAYYWLNHMDEVFNFKTGVFYARTKNMPVDAYDASVENNGYFDGSGIVMGYTTIDSSGNSEVALGADVYLHEMGHANLYFASPSTFNIDSSTHKQDSLGNILCRTANGCMGAIHEGQADFHAALMFPENPKIGEHFFNSAAGLPDRDVTANDAVTAAQAFSSSNGEIHGMGAVYASILWMIYTHPKMLKVDFQRMFAEHLTSLTSSTDFLGTKNIFLAIDTAKYSGKYHDLINKVYAKKGF